MLVWERFGENAGGHHGISLVFHALAGVLFFLAFYKLTGALTRSALVAALWCLHPLNVESVAWVSQLNGVLSAFFWALSMLAYARYVRQPGILSYVVVFPFFLLGIMSKATIMVLPCVFLLLDYWPLGRMGPGRNRVRGFLRLLAEKIPFFLVALVCAKATTMNIKASGKVISMDIVPMSLRIKNILVSYVAYLKKAVWPADLALFYPFPESIPLGHALDAALFLALVTALALWQAKKRPYLIVGWLWYLGVLFPASGLFMQGAWPAMADRWAYMPLIGIYVMATWGLWDLLKDVPYGKKLLTVLAVMVLSGLMATTWVQAGKWKNSDTIFSHSLAVTENNILIHRKYGDYAYSSGRFPEAEKHYQAALAVDSRSTQAMKYFRDALALDPEMVEANDNLGAVLVRMGRPHEALPYIEKALSKEPGAIKPLQNKGMALTPPPALCRSYGYVPESPCDQAGR